MLITLAVLDYKKLHALHITFDGLENLLGELKKLITRHMCEKQQEAIVAWKARTRVWKGSDAMIYKFLRNEPPSKLGMILAPEGPSSDPQVVARTLNRFWGDIEKWGATQGREIALDRLEDFYAAHLPCMKTDIKLTPLLLKHVAKDANASASGLDAWSMKEIKALPFRCLGIFSVGPGNLFWGVELFCAYHVQEDPFGERWGCGSPTK